TTPTDVGRAIWGRPAPVIDALDDFHERSPRNSGKRKGAWRSPLDRRVRPAPPRFPGSKSSAPRTGPMVARTICSIEHDLCHVDLQESWLFFPGKLVRECVLDAPTRIAGAGNGPWKRP